MAEGAVSYVITDSGGNSFPFAGSGSAFSAYVETKDLFSDTRDVIKHVQRIRFIVTDVEDTALSVQVRSRNDLIEDFTDSEYFFLASGDTINLRFKGAKLFRLRFRDTTVNRILRWGLSNFELLGQTGGAREI